MLVLGGRHHRMDEHVAIKCTWQDGGSEGFEEVCSIKIMRLNVMKRVWCSQKDNPCRQFLERGQGGATAAPTVL